VADTPRTLEELEMNHILRALNRNGGSKSAAAAELDISLKTMYNKLKGYGDKDRKAAG
jgi:two-component system NtrC family response regulator